VPPSRTPNRSRGLVTIEYFDLGSEILDGSSAQDLLSWVLGRDRLDFHL